MEPLVPMGGQHQVVQLLPQHILADLSAEQNDEFGLYQVPS